MGLPNFLYVGAPKAGSTWLYQALQAHPCVFVPDSKDTYFFDRYFEKGIDWYRAFFEEAPESSLAVGEICHDYLHDERAASRIRDTLTEPAILVNVREPVERLVSAYRHMLKIGATTARLEDCLSTNPWLMSMSLYSDGIERYGREFKSVHVFDFADLRSDPQGYFNDVCRALAIPPHQLDQTQLLPAQAAQAARSVWLSRASQVAATKLRASGRAELLGRLKHSELIRSVLYSDKAPVTDIASETLEALRQRFTEDVRRLTQLTGVDYWGRWGYG